MPRSSNVCQLLSWSLQNSLLSLNRLAGALLVGLGALVATPAQATWYSENVANGSDIMMMDVRWPWWPESTYFANFNFATNPSGLSGYGGFAIGAPTLEPNHLPNYDPALQEALRPGSVWSFWGANKDGEPVHVAATSPYCYPHQYIGEGASGSLGGPSWSFIKRGRWYRMMMRVWLPVGVENPQFSYMGRWVKDVDDKSWHLYGIMRLPIPVKSFTGNAGFLEDFGNAGRSVRSMHRRLGYCRKDGKWLKSDTVTYDVPAYRGQLDTYWIVNTLPEGDHEVLEMELSSNKAILPQKLTGVPLELGKKHAFTVKQPDQPTLDRPGIIHAYATYNGKQVAVSWHVPPTASPQLSYKLEVFDNVGCTGRPKFVREERMPTVENVLIDTDLAHPTIRLSVTDVFDQTTSPITIRPVAAAKPLPLRSVKTAPGLNYDLYLKDASRHVNVWYPANKKWDESVNESHNWLGLTELVTGIHTQSGVSRGFDVDVRGDRANAYGFRFSGILKAPISGLYLLHMQGSDGFRIKIDGSEALVWDGIHGPTEKTCLLNLGKGGHRLAVDYIVDQSPAPFFKLEWEGPGIRRQDIPLDDLLHEKAGATPEVIVKAVPYGLGSASVTVKVDPKGHAVSKVRLFLGKLQIAESNGPGLAFSGPMLEGENLLWTRVIFDKDHTVDSAPVSLRLASKRVTDWTLSIAGESKAKHGLWQSASNAFSFVGEGEYVLTQKVKGDFTLTCHVDSFAGARGEPVNASSWVGLTAREEASKNNSGWGREFGIMQTGGEGLRTTPNYSDLGGTRVSDFELPKGQSWLRLSRHGNEWTAWTSSDGSAWNFAATHFVPTRPEMDAGVVFRALPQDARAYFQAKVSSVSLEVGTPRLRPQIDQVPALNSLKANMTGISISPSDPNVVVVRSPKNGLLRSTDGGIHWQPANGTLSGAANCVRSIAIDPTNPKIMLRAAGRLGLGGTFEGGLYRTTDGGENWTKLDFPGDFDGEGPSAICGEVIAFDPEKPEVVCVGCESRGFFRSQDGGQTWKLIGGVDERFTAISVGRWVRGTDGQAELHAVTCPDAWMKLLGRGRTRTETKTATASDYLSRDGGQTLQRVATRSELGYLNVAFDKGSWPSEIPYATTLGVAKSMGDGELSFLFPIQKNLDCLGPVTALACSGLDGSFRGRTVSGALNPSKSGRVSISDQSAFNWSWQPMGGDVSASGLIAVAAEPESAKRWWLLALDGLFRSTDGAQTWTRVLNETGKPLKL